MEEEKSVPEIVTNLKKSVATFYTKLEDLSPKIESFEKEVTFLVDKLQDHLEQASICQR